MSIKAFKSNYPGSNKEVQVRSQPAGVHISINARNYESLSIAPTDAPALALAILEAAGVKPQHHMEMAAYAPETLELVAHLLTLHVADSERKAKEAADQETLEAEAWRFAKAHGAADGWESFG